MLRTVVLRHTQADGASHFDWMIEHPELTKERRLMTWRTGVRPDRSVAFLGERIGNHRTVYLDREGDLGAGRGWVERIASGVVRWSGSEAGAVSFEVVWEGGRKIRFEGRIHTGEDWWFTGSEDSPST